MVLLQAGHWDRTKLVAFFGVGVGLGAGSLACAAKPEVSSTSSSGSSLSAIRPPRFFLIFDRFPQYTHSEVKLSLRDESQLFNLPHQGQL